MTPTQRLFFAYFAAMHGRDPKFSQSDMAEAFGVSAPTVSYWKSGKVKMPAHVIDSMARAAGSPALPWIIAIEAQHARTDADRTVWQMALADAGGLPKVGGDESKPLTRHLVDALGGWDTVALALAHEAMVAVGDPDGTRDARQARAKEIAKRPADGETYDDLRARYPAIEACRDVESALALAVRPADDGELAEIRAMADA